MWLSLFLIYTKLGLRGHCGESTGVGLTCSSMGFAKGSAANNSSGVNSQQTHLFAPGQICGDESFLKCARNKCEEMAVEMSRPNFWSKCTRGSMAL